MLNESTKLLCPSIQELGRTPEEENREERFLLLLYIPLQDTFIYIMQEC